jgi:phosphoribosylglycinamide formyltransferase 1
MSLLCHLILRLIKRVKPAVFKPFFYYIFTNFNFSKAIIIMGEEESAIKIAVFASGQGTNAKQIIRYFHEDAHKVLGARVEISLIVSNKPEAGVVNVARESGIPVLLIEKEIFFRGSHYLDEFYNRQISFFVLAGFLWKIPLELIRAYPDRILNIHPALLPNYGGKGMYGSAVHKAVIEAGEKESGISIHFVDEIYDHGRIFFQASCPVSPDETSESLSKKIHELEYKHYPEQIARWMESKLSLNP